MYNAVPIFINNSFIYCLLSWSIKRVNLKIIRQSNKRGIMRQILMIIFLLLFSVQCLAVDNIDSEKYWLNMWNKYNTPNDNGSWTSQAALNLGFYYKNKGSYDNAIIWFNRAGNKYKLIKGNRAAIPAHIADTYILKGDCSQRTFDLYNEAITNVIDSPSYLIEELQQKTYIAMKYCHKL